MNTMLRTGALALALLAGTALAAAPAMADRGHHDNKSWSKSYKKHSYKHRGHHNYAHKGYGRHKGYGYNRGYGRNHYSWYGYRRSYGWPYYYGGPGFSIHIR
jgi:hypothetical protein